MSTIIRVKRRCDEEPQDIIIVNCKRRKTSDETEEADEKSSPTPTVLQLAATVKNQEDDAFTHCKTSLSLKENITSEVKAKCQQNVLQSVRDRIREECLQSSKDNRYRVVNLCRSNSQNDEITIVDVETDKLLEKTSNDVESKPQYVYDLYYTISDDLGEIYDHDLVGVYPLSNELVYGSQRDNGAADSDDDLSEDSNAENNWRNDYPDEDEYRDDASVNEDDMISAMQRVRLDKDDDLSSDDENAGFIYSIDSEAAGFEEDIDDSDVNRYGERYARFKARYKKSERDSSVDDEDFYFEYDDDNDHDNEAHTSYY